MGIGGPDAKLVITVPRKGSSAVRLEYTCVAGSLLEAEVPDVDGEGAPVVEFHRGVPSVGRFVVAYCW